MLGRYLYNRKFLILAQDTHVRLGRRHRNIGTKLADFGQERIERPSPFGSVTSKMLCNLVLFVGPGLRGVLQGKYDCHGMPMPQTEIFLQPCDDLAGLNALLEETFLFGQDSKFFRSLSGFGPDIIEVGFQSHFLSPFYLEKNSTSIGARIFKSTSCGWPCRVRCCAWGIAVASAFAESSIKGITVPFMTREGETTSAARLT